MRQMFEDGRSVADVAEALGVRYQFASNVHRQWKERRPAVTLAPSEPEAQMPLVPEDELADGLGMTRRQIAEVAGVSQKTVDRELQPAGPYDSEPEQAVARNEQPAESNDSEPDAATGPLDLHATMAVLARTRPIFNSEADFQLALAWELKQAHPTAHIRLEYRPAYLDRRGYLDLWAADRGWTAAIELKYFTRALDVVVGGERFELLNQGAQPLSLNFQRHFGLARPFPRSIIA